MTLFIAHYKVPGRKNAACLDLMTPGENLSRARESTSESDADPGFIRYQMLLFPSEQFFFFFFKLASEKQAHAKVKHVRHA